METTLTRGEQEELVAGGAGVGCSQHNKQLCMRYQIDFNLVEGCQDAIWYFTTQDLPKVCHKVYFSYIQFLSKCQIFALNSFRFIGVPLLPTSTIKKSTKITEKTVLAIQFFDSLMFEGFPNEASNKDLIRNGSELSARLGHDDQFETIIICREVFSCLKI